MTLANGWVMAVGGEYLSDVCDQWDGPNCTNWVEDIREAVLEGEWIDPNNPQFGWEELAPSARPRMDHSVAILLPDATVLAADGRSFGGYPNEESAEIFEPPYLFIPNSGGQYAPRPVIGQSPRAVSYDTLFKVNLAEGDVGAEDIAKVTLVRPGATTHGFDQNARFMTLDFSLAQSGNALSITSPANANLAPPGDYMLFLISEPGVNAYGVPSKAKFIRIE